MIFEKIVCAPSILNLIDSGYLVPTECYAPNRPDLSKLKIRMGDFANDGIANLMDRPQLVGSIIEQFLKICPDRKAICYATSVKHSIHICEQFNIAGINSAHIDAKTPKDERDQILKDLASGEIQVISNCMVLTEGFDCPSVSCIILARPTKSLSLYLQMAGRGLRPEPGKFDCIVIDHSGAIHQHGFIETDREWSLWPQDRIFDLESVIKEKELKDPFVCPECKFIFDSRPDCPKCGWKPETKGKSYDYEEGNLERVNRDGTMSAFKDEESEKIRFYQELVFIRKERNHKFGWVGHQFNNKYGHFPERYPYIPAIPSIQTRAYIQQQRVNFARKMQYAKDAAKKSSEEATQ